MNGYGLINKLSAYRRWLRHLTHRILLAVSFWSTSVSTVELSYTVRVNIIQQVNFSSSSYATVPMGMGPPFCANNRVLPSVSVSSNINRLTFRHHLTSQYPWEWAPCHVQTTAIFSLTHPLCFFTHHSLSFSPFLPHSPPTLCLPPPF